MADRGPPADPALMACDRNRGPGVCVGVQSKASPELPAERRTGHTQSHAHEARYPHPRDSVGDAIYCNIFRKSRDWSAQLPFGSSSTEASKCEIASLRLPMPTWILASR